MSVAKKKNTKQNKTKIEAWEVINKASIYQTILIADIESYKVVHESQNPHRTNYQKKNEMEEKSRSKRI